MARQIRDKHKFVVEVPGIASVAFQKCSELSVEVAKIEYWEGGGIIPFKDGGRLTYSDVTLERGVSDSAAFYDWMLEVNNAQIAIAGTDSYGSGLILPDYKRNISILQLDRDNTVVRQWDLFNAWPQKYVAGEWDNTVDEVTIEMVTLTYDYFQLVI